MDVVLSQTNPAAIRQAQRRLQILEEQAARYGINAPPEMLTEIEDLQQALRNALPKNDTDRYLWFLAMLQQQDDQHNARFSTLQSRVTAALTQGAITLLLVLLLLSRAVFVAPASAGITAPTPYPFVAPVSAPASVAPAITQVAGRDTAPIGGRP